MQNRRGLFAGMQSGRLSGFVPYKGTKDLPNAGRISRFIRNFVDMKVALCQFSMEWEAAARNLRRAEELVAQAGARSGPPARDVRHGVRHRTVAEPALPDEEELLAWMRRTARRYATALAGSAVVRSGDRFANRFFFVRPGGRCGAIRQAASFFYRRRRCAFCGGPAARSGRIRRTAVFAARLLRPAFSGLVSLSQRLRRDSLRGLVAGAASGGVADPAAGPGDREPVLCRRRQPHGRRSVEPLCRRFGGRRFQGDAALRGGRFGGGLHGPARQGSARSVPDEISRMARRRRFPAAMTVRGMRFAEKSLPLPGIYSGPDGQRPGRARRG